VEEADRALVEQVLSGSTGAFDELMKRYQRLVYATCLGYASTPEDALDMTQNVFVKVYEKIGSFRGSGMFKAWLLRIAHNEGLNWVRSQAWHRDQRELTPANSPQIGPNQDSNLLQRERWDVLRTALRELNAKQRQAVMLRYFEKTPISEIASILGCTEGTAKNILFRSLRKLRSHLVPHWRES
jgi:RNA polymerase sigma-70 factor (ECF subfamily)